MKPKKEIDKEEISRYSCRYLEGGLSFAYNQIKTCAIRHHGRGAPNLMEYKGGELSYDLLQEKKDEIKKANCGEGHPACIGCPELEKKVWPKKEYLYDWIGITHYIVCNVQCNYCWLQWADWSPRNQDKHPPPQHYDISEIINHFIDNNQLSPDSIIDWGGGGEPTLMKEFDSLFQKFLEYGPIQWIHTNAVRLPKILRHEDLDLSRVKILCSIDCGTPEAYVKMKVKNAFEDVWNNLRRYKELGATVVLKYIMLEENCDNENILGFMTQANTLDNALILTDIDYRFPNPSNNIIEGLKKMHSVASSLNIRVQYGSTGARSALEYEVESKILQTQSDLDIPARNLESIKNKIHSIPYEHGGVASKQVKNFGVFSLPAQHQCSFIIYYRN